MAVTAKWYGAGLVALAAGANWTADTINVTLHTSSYTPNQDTHAVAADLSAEVAAGAGYSTGGVALSSKTRTYDAATNRLSLDAADVSWTAPSGQTLTARYAVIRDVTGDDLLGYVDFGENVSATGAAFTITWDATGVLTVTAA